MNLRGFKFAAFAHYDAYLNNAGAFIQAVTEAGGTADFLTLTSRGMNVSKTQVASACRQWPRMNGCTPLQTNIEDLCNPAFLAGYDGIFLGAGGEELLAGFRNLSKAFQHLGSQRPVIVTGFPGIVDAGRTAGMLFRCPSDIVLLPAPAQLSIYRFEMALLGKHTGNALLYGMPSLPASSVHQVSSEKTNRILFIDQSAIPSSASERKELVKQLIRLLNVHEEAEIWIRERVRDGETSIHEAADGTKLSTVVADLRFDFPSVARIRIKDEPLHALFHHVDGAISVSSTGLVEALAAGLPVASLKTFSHMPEYGNGFFRKSGLQVSIDQILEARWPIADSQWVKSNVLSPLQSAGPDNLTGQQRLVNRLRALLTAPRTKLPNSVNHGYLARRIARLKPHVLLQRMLSPFG